MRTPLALAIPVVVVVACTTDVLAQSRSAPLSVSVVVRPQCVISAGVRSEPAQVSLSCSSHGTRGVQVRVETRGGALKPTVASPNRLEYRLTLDPKRTLLTIQF